MYTKQTIRVEEGNTGSSIIVSNFINSNAIMRHRVGLGVVNAVDFLDKSGNIMFRGTMGYKKFSGIDTVEKFDKFFQTLIVESGVYQFDTYINTSDSNEDVEELFPGYSLNISSKDNWGIIFKFYDKAKNIVAQGVIETPINRKGGFKGYDTNALEFKPTIIDSLMHGGLSGAQITLGLLQTPLFVNYGTIMEYQGTRGIEAIRDFTQRLQVDIEHLGGVQPTIEVHPSVIGLRAKDYDIQVILKTRGRGIINEYHLKIELPNKGVSEVFNKTELPDTLEGYYGIPLYHGTRGVLSDLEGDFFRTESVIHTLDELLKENAVVVVEKGKGTIKGNIGNSKRELSHEDVIITLRGVINNSESIALYGSERGIMLVGHRGNEINYVVLQYKTTSTNKAKRVSYVYPVSNKQGYSLGSNEYGLPKKGYKDYSKAVAGVVKEIDTENGMYQDNTVLAENRYNKEYFTGSRAKGILEHSKVLIYKLILGYETPTRVLEEMQLNHNVGVLLSLPATRNELLYALFLKSMQGRYAIGVKVVTTKGEQEFQHQAVDFMKFICNLPFNIVEVHEVITPNETVLRLNSDKGYEYTIKLGVYSSNGGYTSKNSECEVMYSRLGVNRRKQVIPLTLTVDKESTQEVLTKWGIQVQTFLRDSEEIGVKEMSVLNGEQEVLTQGSVKDTLKLFYNELMYKDFSENNYGIAYSSDGSFKPVKITKNGYESIKGVLIRKPNDTGVRLWLRSIIEY